ncbi:MAG TPA: hypothetical protein P5291_05225, partial [Flavobacteriales bacterium]|nr:hypothetical protein [Flavobacteriales bacterium]
MFMLVGGVRTLSILTSKQRSPEGNVSVCAVKNCFCSWFRSHGMRDMQRAVCQRIFADDMAHISFAKWQGTGNDFIVVDDRSGRFPAADPALVRHLCDRHFGIGCDQVLVVEAPA